MATQEIGLQRHQTGRSARNDLFEPPGACCTGACYAGACYAGANYAGASYAGACYTAASSPTRCGTSGVLDHARRRATDARPTLADVTRDLLRCTSGGA